MPIGAHTAKRASPDIVRLAQEYDAAFYLLLVDEENETYYSINPTAAMLDTVYHNTLNAVIITDSLFFRLRHTRACKPPFGKSSTSGEETRGTNTTVSSAP